MRLIIRLENPMKAKMGMQKKKFLFILLEKTPSKDWKKDFNTSLVPHSHSTKYMISKRNMTFMRHKRIKNYRNALK